MRALHRWAGLFTLLGFLLSGAYMRFHVPPVRDLEPALYYMFKSRHIHILAAAAANLLLGAYVVEAGSPRRWGQRLGSALLVLSAAATLAAFVYEPMSGRTRSGVSTVALYSLFGGTLLHFLAARR